MQKGKGNCMFEYGIVYIVAIVAFAVQLFCCAKVKKKWVQLLPTLLFVCPTIVCFVLTLVSDGWDSIGFLVLTILAGIPAIGCGLAWCGYGAYLGVCRWLCKEDREITRLCDMLRKELLNNGYEYGFVVDGKKYKPDMSNGFDEEYYNQAKTMSIVQDPLVTMQEKIGTCVDTVVVMKHLLDAQKVSSKIWLLYNPMKNKVHTVLTFKVERMVVYLELTPQSSKDCYGKELVYADESEFLQGYVDRGFEVSEVTERVVVGERPEFLLEKIG